MLSRKPKVQSRVRKRVPVLEMVVPVPIEENICNLGLACTHTHTFQELWVYGPLKNSPLVITDKNLGGVIVNSSVRVFYFLGTKLPPLTSSPSFPRPSPKSGEEADTGVE